MDDQTKTPHPSDTEVKNSEVKSLVVLNACAAKFFKKTLGGLTFYDSNRGNDWDLKSPVCVDFVNLIGKK
ncbi:hypothetical protein O0081_13940 [Pseudomonas aeruginosa]|nr:hypothetical protein KK220_13885 [Pseudomonas aeruginosa]